jgi:signal transduction histidine kinase
MAEETSTHPGRVGLCEFIRGHQPRILSAWEAAVRKLPSAGGLSHTALRDHLPELLEHIAQAIETGASSVDGVSHSPEEHALERLSEGFDVGQVAAEYALLRASILRLYREQAASPEREHTLEEVGRFDGAMDQAIVVSVDRYTKSRERTFNALDRIATAALETADVEHFLPRLLQVLLETTASVDSAAVFLVEGETLVLKAALGMGPEQAEPFRLRMGEGFAGAVAATREPLTVRFAAADPLVQHPVLREGTRALFGVPLLDGQELLGVVHVGSRSAFEFSTVDELLIRTMTQRAVALLSKARLREAEAKALHTAEVERARVDTLLEAAPAGVAFFDAGLHVLKVNEAFSQLTGMPMPTAPGVQTLRDTPEAAWSRLLLPCLERVLRSQEPVPGLEVRSEAVDGAPGPRILLMELFPVRAPALATGVGAIVMDVTRQKRVEAELRSAVQFRERFLGIVSHDLRSPLGTITLGAQRLSRDPTLSADAQRDAGRILSAARRMGRMISDLLDFARGRLGGGIPIKPQHTDLRRLARSVLDELRTGAPGRTLLLEAPKPEEGEWDPDRLAQVLTNLCSNALDYGDEQAPVVVRLHAEGTQVLLEVTNQGPPIPQEEIPRIFGSFERASSLRASRGLGLGLYIASEVVKAHGGTLSVRSTAEAGTTFRMALPRYPRR